MAEKKTPTARILDTSSGTRTETDKDGRKITVRKLDLLDEMNLLQVIGNDASSNEIYRTTAVLVYSVVNIDGVPVPEPTTKVAFDANVKRVGHAGLDAAGRAYVALNSPQAVAAVEGEIKNS